MAFFSPLRRRGATIFGAAANTLLSGCYNGDVYGAGNYASGSVCGANYYDYDPYGYDDGYGYNCYDAADYRGGFLNIGFGGGWYDDYYYPGYGTWMYDRYNVRRPPAYNGNRPRDERVTRDRNGTIWREAGSERPNREVRPDRRPRPDGQARPNRPTRPDAQARPDRQPRPDGQARPARQVRPDRQARPERQPRPQREVTSERPPRAERQQRATTREGRSQGGWQRTDGSRRN